MREHGIGTRATDEKCGLALMEWNPPELIHWAHRHIHYAQKNGRPQFNLKKGYTYLAEGYEMNGNYVEALETYRVLLEMQPNKPYYYSKPLGRLHYRLGNREESFNLFCQYIDERVTTYEYYSHSSRKTLQEYLDELIRSIPFIDGYVEPSKQRSMSPFKTYQEFLDFMEEEYAKQESKALFQEAMETYRNFTGKERWGNTLN